VMGHEIFHVLGAVDPCAPHYSGEGHVSDTEADLMFRYVYQGTPVLDPGHDDYYGPPADNHLPASCPASANVANSLFLTSHSFYRLSVTLRGSGTVSVSGSFVCTPSAPADCSPALEGGTEAVLVGVPDEGFHFVGWSGGGCSGAKDCSRTMDADTAVTAMFAVNPTSRFAIKGQGRIEIRGAGSCSKAACSIQLPYDRNTTIRAVPAKHWHFLGWAGACKGKTLSCTFRSKDSLRVLAVFGRS